MTVIGSRGSDLALWQARHVQGLLAQRTGLAADIRVIQTEGDRLPEARLAALEGKGFFTKEIEEALLAGEIDLAVHSHKDLPTVSPAGLVVAAVPPRGAAQECLLVRPEAWDPARDIPLRAGARVGTGSARRAAQLRHARPDLILGDLRGNVPTRVAKAERGEHDAVLLALAGLERLALDTAPLQRRVFTVEQFVPAPAQGALAVQMRAPAAGPAGAADRRLAEAVARLHDEETARAVAAERLLLAACEGGCNLPLGAHAVLRGGRVRLLAALGLPAGGLRRCLCEAPTPAEAAADAHCQLMV